LEDIMHRFIRPTVLLTIAITACLPLPGASGGTRVVETPSPSSTVPTRGLVSVDVRQSQRHIRKKLLEFTPKGTDFDSVSSFVQHKLMHSGGSAPLTGSRPVRISTYAANDSGALAARRKRIATFLGFRHRGVETSTRTAFAAYYAFDESDRLSDVFVVQEEEFLIP
jgi:hypothetical protein